MFALFSLHFPVALKLLGAMLTSSACGLIQTERAFYTSESGPKSEPRVRSFFWSEKTLKLGVGHHIAFEMYSFVLLTVNVL